MFCDLNFIVLFLLAYLNFWRTLPCTRRFLSRIHFEQSGRVPQHELFDQSATFWADEHRFLRILAIWTRLESPLRNRSWVWHYNFILLLRIWNDALDLIFSAASQCDHFFWPEARHFHESVDFFRLEDVFAGKVDDRGSDFTRFALSEEAWSFCCEDVTEA